MAVLITGVSGFLGKAVRRYMVETETVLGWHHEQAVDGSEPVDIRSSKSVLSFFDRNLFDVCIHLAAVADAGRCESDPGVAHAVNVTGTQNVVNACTEHNVRLVYVSTDYVFDGSSADGYEEGDEPAPLQVYGDTKLAGERIVAGFSNSLIVRIPMLYGHNDENDRRTWTKQAVGTLKEGSVLEADDRQVRQPTLIDDVARTVSTLMRMDITGTIHVATNETVTNFKWAQTLARLLGADTELVKPRTDYSRTVPRPVRSTLKTKRMTELGLDALSSPVGGAERYLTSAGLLS